MFIVQPRCAPKAYEIAAQTFAQLYQAVTGRHAARGCEAPADGPLVVIGGDAVNAFAREAYLTGVLQETAVRPGSDDYALISARQNGRDVLFLQGGRGRSTLYAVYAFFSLRAGCRYFWDGDVLPKRQTVEITGLCERKTPDFALRGLRYFAHRGLHRFQAEHWSFADWTREIDWLLKRGLNLFMLRIGADDLFQKAFPELVSYPPADGPLPEAGEGYDDRTLFWPLEYRGALRKKVLAYALERDLLHPDDCGTTTHWYTRTPVDFLQRVNPGFMPQVTDVYRQPTGLVWDIRKDENLERYFTLTRTHAQVYGAGAPQLLHTIGLAERMCAQDRAENLRYKKMAYHRILTRAEQEWPNVRVLVASWDFAMHWEPHEVKALLPELDKAHHLIFDYTADTKDEENNFLQWGFYRQFPWVFGIFHAFEPSSDMRGDYAALSQRLALARADEQCEGLVFWPELSHSDTLMLEYFAKSAWEPVAQAAFLKDFCEDRYGQRAAALQAAWLAFWPLLQQRVWELDRTAAIEDMHQEAFFDVLGYKPLRTLPKNKLARWEEETAQGKTTVSCAQKTLALLAQLPDAALQNEFIRRDAADLARAALGRVLHLALVSFACAAARGEAQYIQAARAGYEALLAALGAVLCAHEDYSQAATLCALRKVCSVNPLFERAFKKNLANSYCRGYAAEFFMGLCIPENRLYLDWLVTDAAQRSTPACDAALEAKKETLYERYLATPLAACPRSTGALYKALAQAKTALEGFSLW